MSELSAALGGAAPSYTLVVDGKTYTMGLITQAAKVAFEKALFNKAREAARMMKEDWGDEYGAKLDELSEKFQEGEFSLEGARGQKSLGKPWGVVMMLSILLGVDQQETMKLMTTHSDELVSLFKLVVKESFPGVKFDEDVEKKVTA